MAKMASFERGDIERAFFLWNIHLYTEDVCFTYTCIIGGAASKMLCEQNDMVQNCDFF